MAYPRLLRPLLVISSLGPLCMAAYQAISNDRCDCYLTDGSSSNWFSNHKFFDFRERSDDVHVPAIIDSSTASSEASATNRYLQSDEWTDNWVLQSWDNAASLKSPQSDASVLMVHSPNNVYFDKNHDPNPDSSTFLNLRTARLKDFQSSCEFESTVHNYHFLSVRMYARTAGAPGAVTAMFTYKDAGNSTELTAVQESDLEVRTVDPTDRVQLTNQPSYTSQGEDEPDATRNATVPDGKHWTDWAVHRMDWNPDSTTWYINGVEVASISFQVPRDPSILIFNAWSDGGSWTGNMSVGTEAHLQVQWIELVYNTTGSAESRKPSKGRIPDHIETPKERAERREEKSCVNICRVDQTPEAGSPGPDGAASRMLSQIGDFGILFWASVLSMAMAFW
ncbi:glycoside hydrolase family 16 protein [Hypoxylon sp. NC1633]|nr:glycoside hydrolase family 16 protein [Hypoxylon sp. NC1633]